MSGFTVDNGIESTITDNPLTSTATTINVADGSDFPSTFPYRMTLWDKSSNPDPADDTGMEIVHVTGRTTNVLTVTRGQEGTSGVEHPSGENIAMLITAGLFNDATYGIQPAVDLNTAKVTNVSTDLSEGTNTVTTVDVNSSDGTNATLVSASTTRAGLLTKAKFDEIVANTAKPSDPVVLADVTRTRANAATGTMLNPSYINNGDTSIGNCSEADAIGEYCEIVFDHPTLISEFKHYGYPSNNENGVWKIQHWDGTAWIDNTLLDTRYSQSWTSAIKLDILTVTTKVRVVCTVVDTGSNISYINEIVFYGISTINKNVPEVHTPSAAAIATLNLNDSKIHDVTMPAGNITLAISNEMNGNIFTVNITQDSTGSRTITWFTGIKWENGTVPTLTTTATKIDTFVFRCTGTDVYLGYIVGQNL